MAVAEKSKFIKNFANTERRIHEIINNPKNVFEHFETLKNIHESTSEMIDQYKFASEEAISSEVLKQGLGLLDGYKSKFKSEVLKHVSKNNYSIKKRPECHANFEIYDEDIYDNLLDNVDLDMKSVGPVERKMIKKYAEVRDEIKDSVSELRDNIENFELDMVGLRSKLIEAVETEVLPTLYKAHMSYAKNIMNKTPGEVTVTINGENIAVSGKQGSFMEECLKKYLH